MTSVRGFWVAWALAAAMAAGQDEGTPKPESPERAADKVVAAFKAKDDKALKALAEKDDPDPWRVADELCFRREHDAAAAFAAAAARPDVARLPAYLKAQRGKPADKATRATLEAMRRAITKKDLAGALAAVQAWSRSEVDVSRVRVLYERARLLLVARKLDESLKAYRAAADAALEIGWLHFAANAFLQGGLAAYQGSAWTVAESLWERFHSVGEQRRDDAQMAMALNNLGLLHTRLGRYRKSLATLERALLLHERTGNRADMCLTLGNIGNNYFRLGDLNKARAFHQRSLAAAREAKERSYVVQALANLANIHAQTGDFKQAVDGYKQVLAVFREQGDSARAMATLANLGLVYEKKGDYRQALEAQKQARALAEVLGDRARAAWATMYMGTAHWRLGDSERALELCLDALARLEQLGDRIAISTALGNVASIHMSRGEYAKALPLYERSIAADRELGDKAGLQTALRNRAALYEARGEFAAARSDLTEALRLGEALGDRFGVADCLAGLGKLYGEELDYAKARAYFARALQLSERIGSRSAVADIALDSADIELHLGNLTLARDLGNRALRMAREIEDPRLEARVLKHLGRTCSRAGAFAEALERLERAVRIQRKIQDRYGEAETLRSMGDVRFLLGSFEQALRLGEEALAILERVGHRDVVLALLDIGRVQSASGKIAEAEATYARALATAEKRDYPVAIALAAEDLGLLHSRRGEPKKAIEFHRRALEIHRNRGHQGSMATALANLGFAYEALGDSKKALECREQSHELANAIGSTRLVVTNLWCLARIQCRLGNHAKAIDLARDAVQRLPVLVRGLEETSGARARERLTGVFEWGLLAAARGGSAEDASYFMESGRAASLLEALRGRDALRGHLLPAALLAEEGKAREAELRARARLRQASRREKAEARVELEGAGARLLAVFDKIRRTQKAAADVLYPQAAPLADIRGSLEEDEALVLYALMSEETVALVVRRGGARTISLGETATIETTCAALADVGVRAGSRGIVVPGDAARTRLFDRDSDPTAAAKKLRDLVVAPLGLDRSVKRLLVSPDGALAAIPFSVLAEDVEIAYVASGTTYGILREVRHHRGSEVLALGDPDYGVKRAARPLSVLVRFAELAPLPGTRAEAKAVGDTVLLGRDASVARLREALASGKRWRSVHLACHGIARSDQPLLSSLALAPDAQAGGLLTVRDVFRSTIPADLVVLSACETGKGRVYKAEGIIGFTRAFMFAGSPRVICSLWKVDDEATRALMVKFYELWSPSAKAMGDKHPQPTATALKNAQAFVRGHDKWKHPYYWAAWQLWGLPD